MRVIDKTRTWRTLRNTLEGTIGFVPTMGALHRGHASLLERSVDENDFTVLSIYVNPTQFNNPDDLDNYPDTMEDDLVLAKRLGVDVVIRPTYNDMYADGYRYQVDENEFSRTLCGEHRSGHFTGVLTVVMKLLNLVLPTRAYFGKKDYQQYRLISDMVETFFMNVEIVGCETIRECDGLAVSSRNINLNGETRKVAPRLHKLLT
ncbi:MAG: pantoate--beta-alanine ligase, partial [Pseudomonadales bacterium]|nr:pantoate--beta-alanine ligase [Pseudomonadales bacterium]